MKQAYEIDHIGTMEVDLKEDYKYPLFGLSRDDSGLLEVINQDAIRVSSRIYGHTTQPFNFIPLKRNIPRGLKSRMIYQNKLKNLLSLGY